MKDIVKFCLIVVFGLIPFGFGVVWVLYRKTIIFSTAMTIFIASMGAAIIAFAVGNKGFIHLYWAIPGALVWLVSANMVSKKLLREPLRELNGAIKEMAGGNLSKKVELSSKNRQNEIGEISKSVETLFTEIYKSTHSISKSAEEVLKMSQEIASTSEQLSIGSDQQVYIVNQLKETMEEMSRITNENSHHATDSQSQSELSANEIMMVNTKMDNLAMAMSEIEEFISKINSIALQTNILALNAAVEAARAGEHGKGFAVVAGEVRKLAENSRNYADEIVVTIQQGVEISNSTAESLAQSVPKINESVIHIKKIADSSAVQLEENSRVIDGIAKVDHQNHNNSSHARLLAESSQTLKKQAEILKNSVEFFRFH